MEQSSSRVLAVGSLVRFDDGTSDTAAVTDGVAISSCPFADGIEVQIALCPGGAGRGLTARGPDRAGGVNERRERGVELVGVDARQVDLVRPTFDGERDLLPFAGLEDGAIEVVDELGDVSSSHVYDITLCPAISSDLAK